MSDVAHVPGQRIQLQKGSSLAEVFASAKKRGGVAAEPRASEPLRDEAIRSPSELQAVIDEAGIRYQDCGALSISLDWWNRHSNDSDWQVAPKQGGPTGGS
jgi:hypothetical protein